MKERSKPGEKATTPVESAVSPPPKQFFQYVELTSPPLSAEARRRVGFLLRALQRGVKLEEPDWKPMTQSIGPGCGELRVRDDKRWWRVVCYVDAQNLVVLELFLKQTNETPSDVKKLCQKRLNEFKTALKG